MLARRSCRQGQRLAEEEQCEGCREEAFPRDPGGIDQGPWASRSCSRSTVTAVLACGVGLVTTLRGARPRRRGVGSAAR